MHETDCYNSNNTKVKCYRHRRFWLYLGIFSTIFFLAMDICITTAAYFNIDGSLSHPKLVALGFALFWSGFTVLGALLILSYIRSRLLICDIYIEYVGVFNRKIMALHKITQVLWRITPIGDNIVLRTSDLKIKIELDCYDKNQKMELTDFFRNNINHDLQNGWERFSKRFSEPPEQRQRKSFNVNLWLWLWFFGSIGCWVAGLRIIAGIYCLISLLSLLLAIISKKRKNKLHFNN
jgi:hypothetical protein